jgi:hypothetical protein
MNSTGPAFGFVHLDTAQCDEPMARCNAAGNCYRLNSLFSGRWHCLCLISSENTTDRIAQEPSTINNITTKETTTTTASKYEIVVWYATGSRKDQKFNTTLLWRPAASVHGSATTPAPSLWSRPLTKPLSALIVGTPPKENDAEVTHDEFIGALARAPMIVVGTSRGDW